MPKDKSIIIKEYRKESGMTQLEVAKKLGVSKQTVQRYESGEISNIPSDKMEIMASCFNVEPWVLLGWESLTKDAGGISVNLALDKELTGYVKKIMDMPQDKKQRVYGYIDSLDDR